MSSSATDRMPRKLLHILFERISTITLMFLCAATIKHALLGDLSRFIHPRYIVFTVSFVSFALIASVHTLGKQHSRSSSHPAMLGAFLVSIIALIAPARVLSSFVASNRFAASTQIQVKEEPTTYQRFSRDLTQFSLSELVSLFQTPSSAETALGATVRVQGFMFEDNGIFIGRFRVACCAIDATPIGVRLGSADVATSLIAGSWYEVEGVIAQDNNGFFVEPKLVTEIQSPEQPYVF